jgi:hypothetical protein
MIITETTDYGTAPEISVVGPCEVERISAGQVRISYYTVFRGEKRIAAHLVWDYEALMRSIATYAHALAALESAPSQTTVLAH